MGCDAGVRCTGYVEVTWLVKVKTDSEGNVHYEAWRQPHDEMTARAQGLTRAGLVSVARTWLGQPWRP